MYSQKRYPQGSGSQKYEKDASLASYDKFADY